MIFGQQITRKTIWVLKYEKWNCFYAKCKLEMAWTAYKEKKRSIPLFHHIVTEIKTYNLHDKLNHHHTKKWFCSFEMMWDLRRDIFESQTRNDKYAFFLHLFGSIWFMSLICDFMASMFIKRLSNHGNIRTENVHFLSACHIETKKTTITRYGNI